MKGWIGDGFLDNVKGDWFFGCWYGGEYCNSGRGRKRRGDVERV